jgi:Ca2+-binding EF-hand superfamily protein
MGACAGKIGPKANSDAEGAEDAEGKPKKKKSVKKKKLTKAQMEVEAVLNHLAVPASAVKKFLLFFKKMDDDDSGSISLEEFIGFLELEKYYVPFIERCFGAMDFNKKGDSKGSLDPTEFTVGLYNLCIMTKDLLENYVFELYDEVHDGNLYQKQIEKMVADSSPHAPEAIEALVEVVFKSLDKDNDGHISKKEFFSLDHKTESLLRPMYLMQSTLQKKCLGESFWDNERVRMQGMMADFKTATILDLLANRVAAKYEAERVKKIEEKGEKIEVELKKDKAKLVKGFDSERNLPGAQVLQFASNNGHGAVFAGDLKAAEEEKMRKDKLKAKKKAKQMKAEGGDANAKKKKKKAEEDNFVSVKGAKAKADASQSWAMKHKEETRMGGGG